MTTRGPRGQEPAEWASLVDGSACPICVEGRPRGIIATLAASWVTAEHEAPAEWYVCVVARRHVVEPCQLPESYRSRFWEDVLAVAQVIHAISGAPKINYEIHGNTIPHLHCHVLPRSAEASTSVVRTDAPLDRLRTAIGSAFGDRPTDQPGPA